MYMYMWGKPLELFGGDWYYTNLGTDIGTNTGNYIGTNAGTNVGTNISTNTSTNTGTNTGTNVGTGTNSDISTSSDVNKPNRPRGTSHVYYMILDSILFDIM